MNSTKSFITHAEGAERKVCRKISIYQTDLLIPLGIHFYCYEELSRAVGKILKPYAERNKF